LSYVIVWIDRELALAIHDRQLAEHGGATGIRDNGLLDSALARPLQMLAYGDPEPDLAELATALAHGIARNHPFVDGNKRTAYVALRTFLVLNGTDVVAPPGERYAAMVRLAEGEITASEFAVWLRASLRAKGVHEPTTPYGAQKRKPVVREKPRRKAK
jgi:death-on-curing protein